MFSLLANFKHRVRRAIVHNSGPDTQAHTHTTGQSCSISGMCRWCLLIIAPGRLTAHCNTQWCGKTSDMTISVLEAAWCDIQVNHKELKTWQRITRGKRLNIGPVAVQEASPRGRRVKGQRLAAKLTLNRPLLRLSNRPTGWLDCRFVFNLNRKSGIKMFLSFGVYCFTSSFASTWQPKHATHADEHAQVGPHTCRASRAARCVPKLALRSHRSAWECQWLISLHGGEEGKVGWGEGVPVGRWSFHSKGRYSTPAATETSN